MVEVPVHIASDLSDAQVKALRLADNKAGEKSFWDIELLRDEIGDLGDLDFDADMKDFGFEEFEVKPVFEENAGNADNSFEEDDIPVSTKINDSLKILRSFFWHLYYYRNSLLIHLYSGYDRFVLENQ